MSAFRPKRLRIWLVVAALLLVTVTTYILIPKRSEMWWRICIRNQDQNILKEVSLTVSDSSQQVLVDTKLNLNISYGEKNTSELCGLAGWHNDMADQILKASNDGVLVSIRAPRCKDQDFKVTRNEIRSSYELPYFRLGGHGSGYHVASMHYRFSYSLDLDCDLATSAGDSTR